MAAFDRTVVHPVETILHRDGHVHERSEYVGHVGAARSALAVISAALGFLAARRYVDRQAV